jgi:hypothetical protein
VHHSISTSLIRRQNRRTKDLCIRREVQSGLPLSNAFLKFPQSECYPLAPPPSVRHHSSTSKGRDGVKKEKEERTELGRKNRELGGEIHHHITEVSEQKNS